MPDLKAYQGDTNVYDVTVVRQNAAVNLTGAKMWFTAKRDLADADAQAAIALNSADDPTQVIFTQATQGKAQIIIRPVDTTAITEEALYYDIQIVESGGIVTTIASGVFRLHPDVTEAYV